MTFTVASNSFKDGDYLPSDFILSSDFGFGCAGGNKSPHLKWRARHRRRKILPSRATTPMRRLARASGTGWWSTSRRMLVNSPKALVARAARCLRAHVADTHRFRRTRLWRAVPAGRRPSAPVSVHGICREWHARREGRHIGSGRRLQLAFQDARESGDYGVVQEVN
jgi:hypothetical protein